MSEPAITVDIKKSENTSRLNSTILLVFLTGMYSTLYFGTIYICFVRSSRNRRLVSATITLLFFTNILQVGMQWYAAKWEFINSGATRDSVFQSLYDSPAFVELIIIISQYIGFVLVDGLLIWRCYFLWDGSVRMILVPLLLVLAEAGLFLAEIVIRVIFTNFLLFPTQAVMSDHVLAAGFFMSFATSLVTTILIAYRIISVLERKGTSAKLLKRILDIVVQMGALCSLTLLVTAISAVLSRTENVFSTQKIAFTDYIQVIASSVAGISTTIVVARVAMLTPDTTLPSTSLHLSGLQFRARSTHHTDTSDGQEISHRENVDSVPLQNGKETLKRAVEYGL